MIPVLRPSPDLRVRVWGGTRLGPATPDGPIGEAWIAGPTSRVPRGTPNSGSSGRSAAGPTLDELAAVHGRSLVGTRSPWRDRFPLLVKLLDPVEWLSVQVHPDDNLARRLAGPDAVGKTEAWYVLAADPDAELLVGVRQGVAAGRVREAIRDGGLAALLEHVTPIAGETILVPAGTLHAVGPGAFLYELQQPSDLTYRADDWGRPATPERPLHVAETLAAWKPEVEPVRSGATAPGTPRAPGMPPAPGAPPAPGLTRDVVVRCSHFVMERLDAASCGPVDVDPAGASPHILTALPGSRVVASGAGWREELGPIETIVVTASAGAYTVGPADDGPATVLLARLPD